MLDSVFVQSEGLMTRNIAGETLIVPIRNRVGDLDSIYTLNEVGVRVWSLVDGQTSVNQMVATISEEYEVDQATAQQDIAELLEDLANAKLIRPV